MVRGFGAAAAAAAAAACVRCLFDIRVSLVLFQATQIQQIAESLDTMRE